ncbi:MAG TPA: UpxY family transcription antiterminator [Syntrophobacteraceae bacterium]|nr:UpxY family transcription antiterminator [Syntrophobacteraceae bacterium]
MNGENDIFAREQAYRPFYETQAEKEWYALYVQVNHEKEVTKRLEQKQVGCFLPTLETWSKRRDRRKKIQLPMFPGYVFVHVVLDSSANLTIVKTPGALSLVHNSEGPLSIPAYQVENLQNMVVSSRPLQIHPYLREGEWVHVVRGPLSGCIGILNRIDPRKGRLIVSVDIIKKSVSVELDLEDVEPAQPPAVR